MTDQDDLTRLAERLGTAREELVMLEGCTPEQLATLDEAVEAAMAREDALVEQGLTDALGFVPRPLRRTATRLFFRGGPRG